MVIIVFVSLIIVSSNAKAEAPIYKPEPPRTYTAKEYIIRYAKQFRTNPKLLLKIANCESEMNTNAIGDAGLAIGIYQYHKNTWNDFVKLYKRKVYDENLNIYSYQDQAKLTSFIFSEYPEYKNRWTTYIAYRKGGEYRFYSYLLKKHFISVCR